jgi:putative nucleotidyltransferase with HDIG domain
MTQELEAQLKHAQLSIEIARERLKCHQSVIKEALMGTVDALAMMSGRHDAYTLRHESRVARLCGAIGKEIGMDSMEQKGLILVGYLHDIGKIGITSEILSRHGGLSPDERVMVKEHPLIGYEVLKCIKFPWRIAEVALQHHERMDGSGYPRRLAGESILVDARIVAVADVVDAMFSERPYREPLGLDAALEEIERYAGTRYDREVVVVCVDLFRRKGFMLEERRKDERQAENKKLHSWDA